MSVFKLIVDRGVVVSPTLAVFERQMGDKGTTDIHMHAFKQMKAFVGRANSAGANVVVGSHSDVPHAKRGWAYQRELELLVDSGLTPMQALVAGTIENARFFRIADRLGSVEPESLPTWCWSKAIRRRTSVTCDDQASHAQRACGNEPKAERHDECRTLGRRVTWLCGSGHWLSLCGLAHS